MRRGLGVDNVDRMWSTLGASGVSSHAHASTQQTKASGQDFRDLGRALKLFCRETLADSLPILVLGFPTCAVGLVAIFLLSHIRAS